MPPAQSHDAFAWLAFTLRPGVPPSAQRALLRRFGTPHAAIQAAPADIAHACGDEEVARAFARGPRGEVVERTLRWLQLPGRKLLALGEEGYPAALLQIADPPTLLYAHGNPGVFASAGIAIVGSRNATPRGVQDAEAFAREISAAGFCVVSGMARGIDAAAHRGALQARGSSVAVLGTGVDIVYPRGHEALAESLAQHGCLLSELPLGMHPDRGNFPRRNRLISGLARGVIVVEASRQSGSLITARCAVDQNRDVFAIPGSIHSSFSKGCHWLIKEGAKLVETAADVLGDYGIESPQPPAAPAAAMGHTLLRAMGFDIVCVDELVGLTGMAAGDIAAQLAALEIEGRVKPLGGGRFQRQTGRAKAAL